MVGQLILRSGFFALRHLLVVLLGAVFIPASLAATYVMPEGDVLGRVTYANVQSSEGLRDIARRYDVGFDEIKAANPHLDPQKPGKGAKVLIPSRYILPRGKREGVVINIAEKRLFHYSRPDKGPALVSTYPVSLGPDALAVRPGLYAVDHRVRKPTWHVSSGDKKRMNAAGKPLRNVVLPGRHNPLGEYAINLNIAGFMIHGTNKPGSIGTNVDYGYVHMYPEDIKTFIHRIAKGTPVRIVNQPFKYGYKKGALYLELHKPAAAKGELNLAALVNWMSQISTQRMWADDWQRVREVAEQSLGVAMPVMQEKDKQGGKPAWWLKLASFNNIQSARKLINKIDPLGVPLSVEGCYDGKLCSVLAGPFRDWKYIDELKKKIKWMTRIKAYTVPYQEVDNFESLAMVAVAK